jgi:nitrite reductase (NO-forming)
MRLLLPYWCVAIAVLSLPAISGCQPGAKPRIPEQPSQQQPAAPAAAAADISHGEAAIGTVGAPAPIPAEAPAPAGGHVRQFRLEISHAPITIDEGVTYDAWTFGGGVPGPALRATVGDTVDFTLVNKAPMPHSMDFHAAEIAPSKYYVNVNPGDSIHYRFVPRVPGVFMYHCGTAPVAAHIANGMYGAFVVDPVIPR